MKETHQLPEKWVDRIFEMLHEMYGEKWIKQYGIPGDSREKYFRETWRTGLYGLNATEIKKALYICRSCNLESVPTPMQFFHYAKGHVYPSIRPIKKITPEQKAVASQNIFHLKGLLSG